MIKRLTIEQFVIIDKLTINFRPQLTVLTGETGAGKSILLDAMGIVLGEPPARESIRQGSEQATIEAHFVPPEKHPVWQFLTEHEFPASQELLVHRIIDRDETGEKDTTTLNGKPVDLELLKKVGELLVEIHGQFANQSLLDPANQMHLLDLFGAYPPEVLGNVRNSLRDVHAYTKELEEERTFIARHGHELMEVDKLVDSMNAFGMRKGLFEESKAEYGRLLTAKETSDVFQSVLSQLVASSGAEQALVRSNNVLASNKNLDQTKMVDLARHLSEALQNTRSAIDEMTRIAPDYDIDTKPIYQFEELLNTMRTIAEDNNVEMEGLYDFYEQMTAKLARIRNSRERITELDDLLEKSKAAYRKAAHILTDKRIEAGKALSAAITAEMPPLKLMRAQFDVQVEEKPDSPWSDLGFNEVIFKARMNPGMPFSPIIETASGGELARLILALKVVLQAVQTTTTLVFDEVDTGIGGAAAAAVGERIARLAKTTQVLVITHSPQVASRGNQHLHVSKKTDGVSTTSVVVDLPLNERIDEISRMLAGDTITTESHAAAKSLIEEASRAAESRTESRAS